MSKITELFDRSHAGCFVDEEFRAEVTRMEAELAELKYEKQMRINAEKKLMEASIRVEIYGGVDTPDDLADEILRLRAKLAALEAQEPVAIVAASPGRCDIGWIQYTPKHNDKLYLAAGAKHD
jgi:ribosomal protein L29